MALVESCQKRYSYFIPSISNLFNVFPFFKCNLKLFMVNSNGGKWLVGNMRAGNKEISLYRKLNIRYNPIPPIFLFHENMNLILALS